MLDVDTLNSAITPEIIRTTELRPKHPFEAPVDTLVARSTWASIIEISDNESRVDLKLGPKHLCFESLHWRAYWILQAPRHNERWRIVIGTTISIGILICLCLALGIADTGRTIAVSAAGRRTECGWKYQVRYRWRKKTWWIRSEHQDSWVTDSSHCWWSVWNKWWSR